MRRGRKVCLGCGREYRLTNSGAIRRHACNWGGPTNQTHVPLRSGGAFAIYSEFDLGRLGAGERRLVNAIADAIWNYNHEGEQQMGERNEVTIPAGTLIHVGGFPFRTITDTTVEGTDANLALGLKALDESANVPTTGEVLGIAG